MNGGMRPFQRQANLLLYLKQDEEQILNAAHAAVNDKSAEFEKLLNEKKVVKQIASGVSFKNQNTSPRVFGSNFPFTFDIQFTEIDACLKSLKHFEAAKEYHRQRFGVMVLIPSNRSSHADKIPPDVKRLGDFGTAYSGETPIIYLNPLPYQLQLGKSKNAEHFLEIQTDLDSSTHSAWTPPINNIIDGAWNLIRSKEGTEWVDERESGFLVFRWQGKQLITKGGEVFSHRKFSTDRSGKTLRVFFDDLDDAENPIGRSKGIYRLNEDRLLLVLLRDKEERATSFPKDFSETESNSMYEYERVK